MTWDPRQDIVAAYIVEMMNALVDMETEMTSPVGYHLMAGWLLKTGWFKDEILPMEIVPSDLAYPDWIKTQLAIHAWLLESKASES